MKIGILYICTGNYTIFWKEFYESCERRLLIDDEKHYFVFTDADEIDDEKENSRIHRIFQKNLGWPDNTLKRYHIFLQVEDMYSDMDYLYFFNANLKVIKNIEREEFLPQPGNLMVTMHPGYFNKINEQFTYERNDLSTAYIPLGEGDYYIAGGLNGGRTEDFLNLARELKTNVDVDEKNHIVACWHDESHINHYIYTHKNFELLSPAYLYPEGLDLPFIPKILIRDKRKYGGHAVLRDGDFKVFCSKYKHIYIYGAGVKGKRLSEKMKEEHILFDGFIISDGQTKPDGMNVQYISEVKDAKECTGIIIAMRSEFEGNAKMLCQSCGYSNIYISY